jgi:epoxyqueuosine reductase
MGNSRNPVYVTDLIRAFQENFDERVKCMTVWALGRIGGSRAKAALKKFLPESAGTVREENQQAIKASKNNILNR